MKKLTLLITIFFLFGLISCEKDYLIPDKEVPEWLKTKISQDEQEMKDFPQSWKYYGGWLRYEWQNEHYFEYHNELSSSLPGVISAKGDTLHIWANDINTDYYKEKCCKQYVWKAPKYREFAGI